MKKEKLLSKKKDIVRDMVWYLNQTFTDEEIASFSLQQLELLKGIFKRAEETREKASPFYSLSACEVIRKDTEAIGWFDEDGTVSQITEEEVMSGASRRVYQNYKDGTIK